MNPESVNCAFLCLIMKFAYQQFSLVRGLIFQLRETIFFQFEIEHSFPQMKLTFVISQECFLQQKSQSDKQKNIKKNQKIFPLSIFYLFDCKLLSNTKYSMQYRYLGPTGIQVSVISYGNWLNSNSQQARQNTIDCVKTAWDNGVNFFDTAQVYGYGQAELQFGEALKALKVPRHKYVLSTKIFWGTSQYIPTRRGLSRKHIIEGVRASLKRLQEDYVDVCFCHRPDIQTPVEQTCRAFDWLIRKGYVFYWGTSEWTAEQIAQAHYICQKYSLNKPVVEQPQYNLYSREKMEIDFARLFEQKKLGTTVWSPLASGILTGKYNQGIPEGSRFDKNSDIKHIFQRYFNEEKKQHTITALKQFKQLADELKISMAQLAMAWVIKSPDVSTAITGASSPKQLEETLKAVEYQKLITPQVEKRIQKIFGTVPTGKRNMKTLEFQKSRRVKILQ